MTSGESTDSTGESNSTESDDSTGPDDSVDTKDGRRNDRRVCRDTGREQGLVGKYDIWLCRQSFRELAREMGFRKYN